MVADINLTVICALFVGVSFREASLVKKSIRILLSQTICQGVVFAELQRKEPEIYYANKVHLCYRVFLFFKAKCARRVW